MSLRILFFSPFLFLFLSQSTLAYELLQPGGRANSLGGAFIGISDDWSALYWNPAGLFQSLDQELAVEGEYLSLKIKDGDSLANGTGIFSHRIEGEKERFSQEEAFSQSHLLPSIGFILPAKGLVLGFGIFPRLGEYLDWRDEGAPDLEASLKRRMQIYNGSLAFSVHIAPIIYAGISLNLLHGEYEFLADKKYKGARSYTFQYCLNHSKGTGFEVALGGLCQLQQLLSLGWVYRSGGSISLKGDANAKCTALGCPVNESSGYTKMIYLPPSYGIGLAMRYIPKTTIGLDWSKVGWDSWREDYSFETEGRVLKSPGERNPGWKGADQWSLGLEIRPSEEWRLTLGGFSVQSPLSNSKIDLANGMVEVERLGISGGIGYKRDSWEFGLAHLTSNGQTKINDVGYQKDISKTQILIKVYFF